jgi:hypothetical protein
MKALSFLSILVADFSQGTALLPGKQYIAHAGPNPTAFTAFGVTATKDRGLM